ncbi:hypothetical protein KIW84_013632 [Lathyrus oleraceus]|uniref:Retrotransposon Copia-like N-terminal domain-containing protein n=1 Tax=Pisum sativum TaxID=3888 RepID=A0A9D5GY34_PEA|nr:hypothetical protein KIW84_013632 [Pisum sativum]
MASQNSDVETSQRTPIVSSPADKLVVLNAGSQLCIKFDGDIYPAWRIQFMVLFTGYGLMGYVDGRHVAKNYYIIKGFPKKNDTKPTVNLAQNQAATQHPKWIIDIIASHHISQDMQQLTLDNSYPGADQVIVGNKTCLEIIRTGLEFGSSTAPRST